MLQLSQYFPITDPTLIFFVVLLIILFAPIIMGKLRIPYITGMIIAGIIVGPHGLGILIKDSSFAIFGNVGLYYIMLLSGLEMNMSDFRNNKTKTFTHGILAFAIPIIIGFCFNTTLLKYGFLTSVLLASMYASHTLIAYPTVLRFGLSQKRSVTIAVGATAITDTLTLFVLAIVSGIFKGNINGIYWILFFIKASIVFFIIIYFFPRMARYFFKKYENNVYQFIFVLAMAFLGASMMEAIGMEGLLGAFLTGLVLNRYVPNVSPLMNHLEFVGNAVFIPYFLIGVGMLVNVNILFTGFNTWKVAIVMITVALSSKWFASLATQKIFGLKSTERELIYGLSNAQAGATLAAVLIGYNMIMPNGQRLLNDDILNGTIILILVTCIFSSFTTERAAKKIVLQTRNTEPEKKPFDDERILVPIKYPEIANNLINMAIMMRNKKLGRGLIGLNVVYEDDNMRENLERGKQLLDRMTLYANSAGVLMQTQVRIAANIANGIKHAFNEFQASEIIIGMHFHKEVSNKFWGEFHQSLFNGLNRQIIMARLMQPLSTLRSIQVAVPSRAQFEPGFYRWMERLARLAENLECRIQFHGRSDTIALITEFIQNHHSEARASYSNMEHWSSMPELADTISDDHLFVVVTARKGTVSYKNALDRLPDELTRYYNGKNLMIIFPDQYGDAMGEMTFAQPQHTEEMSAYEAIKRWFDRKIRQ